MTMLEMYGEGNSRPDDTPLTDEERARYAANLAARKAWAEARIKEKAAKEPKPPVFLATDAEIVKFEPVGDTVTVTVRNGSPYLKRTKMPIAQARAEYARLLSEGYYCW